MSISITIDGQVYQACAGDMIIEVTDKFGVAVPRFCYHNKLSIAANCRMCLVEVEKLPKPVPACATPVSEGMVIHTKSQKTQLSQKAVMEFLLINHPLDCPICDQGGECELQDLAVKYGYSQSSYQEDKRVAQDFNLGPLVATDMTRCIHCTRCIRFGNEIAGISEMGATSRGEFMQVGTYLENHLSSELSANVIDICPVGALTSKPHRSKGRTWELSSADGVSFFESFGSNLYWHHHEGLLRRIVPRENKELNENWIADKDRYSCLSMYDSSRLATPLLKKDEQFVEVSHEQALNIIAEKLTEKEHNSTSLAGLIHPSATFEEAYLFQKLIKELGSFSVDHRINQRDISDQDQISFSQTLPYDLNTLLGSSILIIGNYLNEDEPLLAHRLRQAARSGTKIYQIGWSEDSMNMDLRTLTMRPESFVDSLRIFLKELLEKNDTSLSLSTQLREAILDQPLDSSQRDFFDQLQQEEKVNILLAPSLHSQPHLAQIRFLAQNIAHFLQGQSGTLYPQHSIGCSMAGAHPHHGSISDRKTFQPGLEYAQMNQSSLEILILFDIYPEDTLDPAYFLSMIEKADCVIGFYSYHNSFTEHYCDILLPIALLSENEGHHINAFGAAQYSESAHRPFKEAKQGWRYFKVLADKCHLSSFNYQKILDVFNQGYLQAQDLQLEDTLTLPKLSSLSEPEKIDHIHLLHPLRQHELLRRSEPLQQTTLGQKADLIFIHPATAELHQLLSGDQVQVIQGDKSIKGQLQFDDKLSAQVIQTYSSDHDFYKTVGKVEIRKVS